MKSRAGCAQAPDTSGKAPPPRHHGAHGGHAPPGRVITYRIA
ncbi:MULTISPECIES: hypothetical protein [Novacetimonas]|uniref:Uncharacterized protein n=1 Tax=Novacetimonas hansenii ATCC 23769 TaxID=714995 RepID=D5QH39_NOVHA|nr:hypothetical protein [Novacetimonas hansenii]EFG83632.1 hypothetical protein GXY_12633 [Novacetimonas hansenii ATCC 23769]WEQ58976.1 hypothetical protein LV563_14430 [Novacetimonas hansenii]